MADGSRRDSLRHKLQEIQERLKSMENDIPDEQPEEGKPVVTGLSDNVTVRFPDGREVSVVIGTSRHMEIAGMVDRICSIVFESYTSVGKRKHMDQYDAEERLAMGDAGVRANRVLHLAFIDGELVGCASSTFQPGWTPEGCGHWGLLAVDPAHQRKGVATALIFAAERRLATMMEMIQIEYQHMGDEYSERLRQWYEGKLGFDGGGPPRPGFRRCIKQIPEIEQRRGERRRLEEIRDWLAQELAKEEEAFQVVKSSRGPSLLAAAS